MPGWHAKTAALEKAGKLNVAGIAQEQHADRTQLFMQWKQMGWPVMVDAFNLYGVTAVPITLFVDEHGVIQKMNPRPEDLDPFLGTSFPAPDQEADVLKLAMNHFARNAVPRCVDSTIRGHWKREGNRSAEENFQYGVLYRMRYDSTYRQPGDFARAVAHWRDALARKPNQYIWRRRIQQYGPRLDKPYSFYDWVATAREEITARGETPVALVAEPSGAEFARPSRRSTGITPTGDRKHPDPDAKLNRDTNGLIAAEAVVVPSTTGDKPGCRVHLTFTPNRGRDAHWNNESGDAFFWTDAAPGGAVLPVPENPTVTSEEPRTIEFEADGGGNSVTGTLFFYVCEGENGVCRYLAKDVSVKLR